jgi:hypothetical protein
LILAVGLAACDSGIFRVDPATLPTEPLVVLGANVGTNKPLPANGAIHLAFNRYLLPSTITRQAVTITPVGGSPLSAPIVTYDPVARTVTIQTPLQEGQSYRVTVKVPSEADRNGLLALDGATLAEPVSFQFLAGPPSQEAFKEPPVGLCEDVLPILAAKCGGGGCHSDGGGTAASSLVLDTSVGLRNTAIGRAAQGSTTGGTSRPLAPGRVFGINMPLVDPGVPDPPGGNPGNSWLLYKILLAPLPQAGTPLSYTCTAPLSPPVAYERLLQTQTDAPTALETSVLQDYVPGREMPYPLAGAATTYGQLPLTFNERELVRMWIAQGAKAPDCQGCRSITPEERDGGVAPPDAGGSDAGGSDAGSDASGPDASADAGSD